MHYTHHPLHTRHTEHTDYTCSTHVTYHTRCRHTAHIYTIHTPCCTCITKRTHTTYFHNQIHPGHFTHTDTTHHTLTHRCHTHSPPHATPSYSHIPPHTHTHTLSDTCEHSRTHTLTPTYLHTCMLSHTHTRLILSHTHTHSHTVHMLTHSHSPPHTPSLSSSSPTRRVSWNKKLLGHPCPEASATKGRTARVTPSGKAGHRLGNTRPSVGRPREEGTVGVRGFTPRPSPQTHGPDD